MHVTRVNITNVPSSIIEIIDSKFEHSSDDKEMCRFYNIQPSDSILIRGTTFIHSYCSVYFGESEVSSPNYSLIVENSLFTDYSSHPSMNIRDLSDTCFIIMTVKNRSVTVFRNNTFKFHNGPSSVIYIDLEANNANNYQKPRVIFESDNRFIENDVTDLIYFECGVDSVSKQVANDSYPIPIVSVYFEDTIFRENEVEYIIRPVNKGTVPIVELNSANV